MTTVNVTVEGDNILQSGVRQYSLYGSSSNWYTIRCEMNTAVQQNEVSIVQNEYIILPGQTKVPSRFSTKWEKRIYLNYPIYNFLVKYTCRAWISVDCPSFVNGDQCHSVIESDVTVTIEMEPSIASTVGSSVYIGEVISTQCISYYRRDGFYCNIQSWQSSLATKNIVSTTAYINDCTWERTNSWNRPVCHRAGINLHIFPTLNLSLTPSNFSRNVTTLHFNCTSVPPRLMRWTIITDSGDIIDFRSPYDIIKVSMNVTITQKPGETILNISEAAAGGNGILSVICSSYNTPAKVSASSHREFIDECSCDDAFKVPSTDTVPSTPKSTVLYKQGTTPYYNSSHTAEPKQGQPCRSCGESTYNVLLITTLATTVGILVVVVIILLRKLRSAAVNASPKTCQKNGNAHTETVLHDNPVYLSYSEEAVCGPCDAGQSATSVYVNI